MDFGTSELRNITRMDNALDEIPKRLDNQRENLNRFKDELEKSKKEVQKPFEQATLLTEKRQRLSEVNKLIETEMKNRNSISEKERIEKLDMEKHCSIQNSKFVSRVYINLTLHNTHSNFFKHSK